MDFALDARTEELREELLDFMTRRIEPAEPVFHDQLAAYVAASGREPGDMAGEMNWHLGLAYFKLAVILEGIHFRYLQGQTVGEGFDRIGALVPGIVRRGLDALDT